MRQLNGTEAPAHIDEHLVTLFNRSTADVQQYKALRYSLERLFGGDGLNVLAVTSPAVGDGKTTTAINLAGVSAHRRNARILLVDADLRRPSVASRLRIANEPGLADLILDADRPLSSAISHLPAFNLSVLPAGRASEDPYELLRTPRLKDLLQEMRQQYELVVVDTAPILLVPDSRVLENCVDAFLLVVAAHYTARRLVEDALNLLGPSKLIALAYNRDDRPPSGYYGHYYGSTRTS